MSLDSLPRDLMSESLKRPLQATVSDLSNENQKRVKPLPDTSNANSSDDFSAFLLEHEITFHEANPPPPCISFDKAPFPKQIVDLLVSQYKIPSPVQASSWPLAAAGRDVLAIAKTGSGKTLGFLLPAIVRCNREKNNNFPKVLILAPTRELAIQICSEATKFGKPLGCRAVALYGGAPKSVQASALRRGCEIIVATPGRLKDMLETGEASLKHCNMVIFDEADRMLDMGFEKDIRNIVWQVGPETETQNHHYQTLMYSATWGPEVEGFAAELLTNPVKVTIGNGGEKLTANKSVTQNIHVVEGKKSDSLLKLLTTFRPQGSDVGKKLMIFANRKCDVKWLRDFLWRNGLNVDSISGDRPQSQRESVINRFRDGSLKIVIATDVCGRGLDIKDVHRVINYDFPGPDDYIHRIGRCGRGGNTGRADSFFTEHDKLHAKELIRILTDAEQVVPPALAKFTSQSIQFDSDSD